MNRCPILSSISDNESYRNETRANAFQSTSEQSISKLDQNRINNNIVVTTYSLAERTLIQPSILPEFDNDNSLRILNFESSNSHRNNICVLKLEFKYIFMLLIENTLFISLSVMSNNNDIFTIVFPFTI
ncbi:hypothetical protein LUQ84_001601 [Hamiltosporidium tvaerminnensis]|nr:hypothetical protein LUQ84_001601 [Hamiltosporidium tvaerminnensis]